MKSSTKHCDDGEKSKPQYEVTAGTRNLNRGHLAYKKQALPVLSLNSLQAFKLIEHFVPFKLPINAVFNAIKDQPWVRRPRTIQYKLALPGVEEYYFIHDSKGYRTIYCKNLRRYMKVLVCQGFLKEYVFTPEAASESELPNVPSLVQLLHNITQYIAIVPHL